MQDPVSPHFHPISLSRHFNADRNQVGGGLALRDGYDWTATSAFGSRSFRGIPFDLGEVNRDNIILLERGARVEISTGALLATYVLFLHAAEDRDPEPDDAWGASGPFNGGPAEGNDVGPEVATYTLEFVGGATTSIPVARRIAIQQRHISWGASAFAAEPAAEPVVLNTATEDFLLGQVASTAYGRSENRARSGRDSDEEHLWMYALPNPDPDKAIRSIRLDAGKERVAIYAISTTTLEQHPLRREPRQKAAVTLPPGVPLNALNEIDSDTERARIGIDLGTVISTRALLNYDSDRWSGNEPDVQPAPSQRRVLVEYTAHPRAALHLDAVSGSVSSELTVENSAALKIEPVASADRPVRILIRDEETGQPTPARIHLHGAAGEYLPPRGYHRKVNPHWFEDNYGEFINGLNQYCYFPGEAIADLPLGEVFIEISRGYDTDPIRTSFIVDSDLEEISFDLKRRLDWRERGWISADTHVHFLSPQTALLEGKAEGVNVVNLLASQWGEMFSNVSDFDGHTVFGARDFGGDGEFVVRVGTENRQQVLGHISLLGYSGAMIHPLGTGGPSESALGDPLDTSMAEWAERCIEQGGLVVMPHGPNPQAERAADIVLELVHAIEMMTFNPHDGQISPYGLYDWYRYLNLGYHLPIVGGSDKMSAASLLGGIRTYAQVERADFTYQQWMDAVRSGNTFVTVGPLIDFTVNGTTPGNRIDLSSDGGTLDIVWNVESVKVPIERVELIAGGEVVESFEAGGSMTASGSASFRIARSTWLALRVRGGYNGRSNDVAAHSSAIQVITGGRQVFSGTDAARVLHQIEGTIAWVDTLAPRGTADRYLRVRSSLESAHRQLHQRMHELGYGHNHSPLHSIDEQREH